MVNGILITMRGPILIRPNERRPRPTLGIVISKGARNKNIPPITVTINGNATITYTDSRSTKLYERQIKYLPRGKTRQEVKNMCAVNMDIMLNTKTNML